MQNHDSFLCCKSYRHIRYSLNFNTMELDDSSKYDGVRRLTNSDSQVKNPFFASEWKIYWWNNLSWEEYNKVHVFFLFCFSTIFFFVLSSTQCHFSAAPCSPTGSCLVERVHPAAKEHERKGARVFLLHQLAGVQAGLHHHDPDQRHHRVSEGSSLQTGLPLP